MHPTLKTIDSDQLLLMLAHIHGIPGPFLPTCHDRRNEAMVSTLWETGLRVNELVQLRTSDLIFQGEPVHTLRVRAEIAKGKLERVIPISKVMHTLIKDLCIYCWPTTADTVPHYAFFSRNPDTYISTRTVERIIKDAGRAALGLTVTPHMLRHSFATRMLAVTNIRVVQTLLGHKSIRSTQIYTHPTNPDLRKAIDAAEESDTRLDGK